jgi:hypothetical protein
MTRDDMIKEVTRLNLELCSQETGASFNDEFIYDLLVYGCKGFNNMTDDELAIELEQLK